MAEVTIKRYEQSSKFMPPICIVCGKHADQYVERQFVPISPTVYLLPGLLKGVATRAHRDHTPSIDLPFCSFHAWHYDIRSILVALSIVILFPLSMLFLLLSIEPKDSTSFIVAITISILCFSGMIAIARWAPRTTIKPKKIHENDDVTYDGFHEAFITELLRRRQMNIDEAKKRAQS